MSGNTVTGGGMVSTVAIIVLLPVLPAASVTITLIGSSPCGSVLSWAGVSVRLQLP
ncbi:hypothetical protein ACN1T9_003747 [Cronobacter sakazakii]